MTAVLYSVGILKDVGDEKSYGTWCIKWHRKNGYFKYQIIKYLSL